MPAKKDETKEGVKKPVAKKTATKKTVAKKTVAKKETATKKASTKKASPAKKVTAAKKAPTKKGTTATILSKGKQRKLRVEDKFSGKQYHLGVGKRKSAIALVRLHEKGKGEVFINNKKIDEYLFGILIENALQPLALTGKEKDFNITIKVEGGGVSSQADAIRHGIARALVLFNSDFRPVLKKAGLLTRDARVKERKKPGLKGARRAPQWKKR